MKSSCSNENRWDATLLACTARNILNHGWGRKPLNKLLLSIKGAFSRDGGDVKTDGCMFLTVSVSYIGNTNKNKNKLNLLPIIKSTLSILTNVVRIFIYILYTMNGF